MTALELAHESARGDPCGCGARAGYTCDGRGGIHFARFADAHEAGLLGDERWAAVLAAAGDAPTDGTIVARDGEGAERWRSAVPKGPRPLTAHNPGVSG